MGLSLLDSRILHQREFTNTTVSQLLKVNDWLVIVPAVILSLGFLLMVEYWGL